MTMRFAELLNRLDQRIRGVAPPEEAARAQPPSVAIRRFVLGLTSEETLSSELVGLGASPQDLHNLIYRAGLERETELAERLLSQLRAAVRARRIGKGVFIATLADAGWSVENAQLLAELEELTIPAQSEPSRT